MGAVSVGSDRISSSTVETSDIERPLSLPVLWAVNGGLARPGRLDLDARTLTLSGGSRAEPRLHEIGIGDLADVRIGRRPDERIGGRVSVVLELRDGRVVSVVDFSPVGAVRELAERLWELMGVQPEARPRANGRTT